MAESGGSTTVREEDGDLVQTLVREREKVPEGIGILPVGLGVALLGVDKVWELEGVTTMKKRRRL